MKPLLVGELNPYGADPRAALWPAPVNSSGWRLCTKILGMTPRTYLRNFDRMNLCAGTWSKVTAKTAALDIMAHREGPLVLLGAKVCDAFGVAYQPFSVQLNLLDPRNEILVLPHPSGRCFAWNDPEANLRAQKVIQKLLDQSVTCQDIKWRPR